MSIENFKNPLKQKDLSQNNAILDQAIKKAGELYDSLEPVELIPRIEEELKLILDSGLVDAESIKEKLLEVDITDREAFVAEVTKAIGPVIDFIEEKPDEYEEMKRKELLERDGNIKVNELIFYSKNQPDSIQMHIAPNEHTSLRDKLSLLKDGMIKLAEVVEKDETIKEVTATSWIVAEAPGLIERLGFENHGEISDEFKQQQFSEEDRPVHHAIISREVLLEKYLK